MDTILKVLCAALLTLKRSCEVAVGFCMDKLFVDFSA
jgi:hypothetical protein